MKTKIVNLYTFSELSDTAKEKARDWWREASAGDSYWSECTIDEAKEQGQTMGLSISDVYFRGFWSQGDGACCEGSWSACDVKPGETAKGWGDSAATRELVAISREFTEFAQAWPESSFTVKHRGHYSHEHCTDFSVSLGEDADNNEEITPAQWQGAEASIIGTARAFMRWIYRQLEKECEYQNSAECIDLSLESNEYTFTEEGERED